MGAAGAAGGGTRQTAGHTGRVGSAVRTRPAHDGGDAGGRLPAGADTGAGADTVSGVHARARPDAAARVRVPGPAGSRGYAYPGPPPAQPAYGYPGYQGYPGYPGYPQKSNGFGVTALVLGIVGVVTCYLGVLFGVPAVIFGALGRGKARRGEADNGSMALAGIILGSVSILISILMIALVIAGVLLGDPGSDSDFDGPASPTRIRENV